tara:strand:- start:18501 stop:18896 length:396 start_codon:yes stop_codon:yes gene_type:complete
MTALLEWLSRNLRLLGILAVLVCAVTWWIDLSGLVHECVYCRAQRTAIGLVGLVMLLPDPRRWWLRYPALCVGFLGAHVACAQLFLVIRNLNAGEPSNPVNMILAAGALGILVGQALLLWMPRPADSTGSA